MGKKDHALFHGKEESAMELVSLYLEHHPIPPAEANRYHSEGIYSVWDDFISSQCDVISVIAGRQTGKTTAITKRAILQREQDVIVMVHSWPMVTAYVDHILHESAFMDYQAEILTRSSNRTAIEIYVNDHTIHIMKAEYAGGMMRQYFHNKEIIYDEPEFYHNRILLDQIVDMLDHHSRVVMAGTMMIKDPTVVKQIHASCESSERSYANIIPSTLFLDEVLLGEYRTHMFDDRFKLEYLCAWD
jgi:hypothetical protein